MPEMTPLEARLTKEVEALRQENKLLRACPLNNAKSHNAAKVGEWNAIIPVM